MFFLPTVNAAVIEINPANDSCESTNAKYSSCAQACEAKSLECAQVIHTYVNTPAFKAKRIPYLGLMKDDPNPTTPMHGLFNTMYINEIAETGIQQGIADPFDSVELPPWSIVLKYNENPGIIPANATWETHIYKIPGYCPKRITAAEDSGCVGGEWFWFLYRNGEFLSFDFDPVYGSEHAWGKAEHFCLDCHGAVASSDWLWKVHFRRDRERQELKPITNDGQTPGSGGAGFCQDVTALNTQLPLDVSQNPVAVKPPNSAQRMFDCFAWEAFVALNWPSKIDQRGEPDTEVPFNTENRNRVWETYKQVYETFQPENSSWTLAEQQWNDVQPLPGVCAIALDEASPSVEPEEVRAYQVLNESHQAFGNQFNNLIDSNGNELRYNVRFNRTEWLFMQDNGYADTGQYDYNGPLNSFITFPDNRTEAGGSGVMEIKSSWKELCTDASTCSPVDNPEHYYSRNAFIYNPAVVKSKGTQPENCRIAQVGLLGLHIMAKTFWAPQWIWATFEHNSNVPDVGGNLEPMAEPNPYSLFNPMCLVDPPTQEECLGTRPGIIPQLAEKNPKLFCCNNLQNILNALPDPDNPPLFQQAKGDLSPEAPNIPVQVTRIDPIGEDAKALNKIFQAQLKEAESPFQYYQLINTQWPAKGRLGADANPPYAIVNKLCLKSDPDNCFTFKPDGLRLRNSSMETFQTSYCKPDDENIDNDPADCNFVAISEDPQQASSGGCMNCHIPTGNDTSFIWADAIEEQVPLNPD
jgi:hypothetical protein